MTTNTTYDSLGRVASVNNPSSGASETYNYDALGRPADVGTTKAITRADGNTVSITYSGNCVTVTDEGGATRKLCSDALGRVTSVTEDPSGLAYQTTYTYDVLNDLTGVTQGSQSRSYAYDGLGRLTSAKTPEMNNCAVTYMYNSSGDLATRTAPEPNQVSCATTVTTTFTFDTMHRLTQKSYSDGTPTANFFYDETLTVGTATTVNTKGRLSHTWNGQANTTYSYDPMGRVQDFWQCTPYNCSTSPIWNMHYNYDGAGDIANWANASGTTFTQTISGAQQITQVASSLSDSNHPATLATISYTPWGAISTFLNGCAGTGCVQTQQTYSYNNRLQMTRVQLGTAANNNSYNCFVYNYYPGVALPTGCAQGSQGSGDNGNVAGYYFRDSVNSSQGHTASYTYDALNRMATAGANNLSGVGLWSQTYTYGQYGNMSCSGSGLCASMTYNTANNRLTAIGSATPTYDADGDLTSDGTGTGTHTYQYDAEERLKSIDNGTTASYTYNSLGWRVETHAGTAYHEFVYDPAGVQVGRNDRGSSFFWQYLMLGEQPFGKYQDGKTYFLHSNNLGSTSFLTDQTGAVIQDILYYPWGSQWSLAGTNKDQHFAGLWQDPESGLLHANARKLDSTLGRWLSPDPDNAGADVSNPQSWNAYAYVLNDPTINTDPSGLDCLYLSSSSANSIDVGVEQGFCSEKGGVYINGTVDANSFKYNGSELSYSYTPYSGGSGTGLIDFDTPGPSYADQVFSQPVIGYAAGTIKNYIAPALAGFMIAALPPVLESSLGLPAAGLELTGRSESTGRTLPVNLKEQLAMQEAKSNPRAGIHLTDVPMTDPRWPGDRGWIKMAQNVNGVEVHYNLNTETGETADWKFK